MSYQEYNEHNEYIEGSIGKGCDKEIESVEKPHVAKGNASKSDLQKSVGEYLGFWEDYHNRKDQIQSQFETEILQVYKVDEGMILLAYDIMNASGNDFRYEDVENFVRVIEHHQECFKN
jgi:hypothetical protein